MLVEAKCAWWNVDGCCVVEGTLATSSLADLKDPESLESNDFHDGISAYMTVNLVFQVCSFGTKVSIRPLLLRTTRVLEGMTRSTPQHGLGICITAQAQFSVPGSIQGASWPSRFFVRY